MAEAILIKKTDVSVANGGLTLSPQQSQSSLFSSPEVVDLYCQTVGSSVEGRPSSGSAYGELSSSFILVSDRSGISSMDPSEYVEVRSQPLGGHDKTTQEPPPSGVADTHTINSALAAGEKEHLTELMSEEPTVWNAAVLKSSAVDHSDSVRDSEMGGLNAVTIAAEPKMFERDPLQIPTVTTTEVGTQASTDISDGCSQTLPEIKKDKQLQTSALTTPTSIFHEHTILDVSPLASPSEEEIVDMSASTVLIERHISQKEGRILKNNNKELRLKIKKLTEVMEQMQKQKETVKNENERLKSELESGTKVADIEAAMELKEKEFRRYVEELEEQQELELEQYRNRLQKAVKYEERVEEKLKENVEVISELQKSINLLQEQLVELKKKHTQSTEKSELLISKLQASEMKRVVTESENSVLNEKVNQLTKELATLRKSHKHHHHHHSHHEHSDDKTKPSSHPDTTVNEQTPGKDPEDMTSESKTGEEPKQDLQKSTVGTSQGNDATQRTIESSLSNEVRSHPKPKPRQKFYEPHDPKSKQKESRPRPAQALVAPRLQSVAHLHHMMPHQKQQLQQSGSHLLPRHQQQVLTKPPPQLHSTAGRDLQQQQQQLNRPSFLPLKGQKQEPPLAAPRAQPPPPLSDAQKLAATASWVQQLPEPNERKIIIENKTDKGRVKQEYTEAVDVPKPNERLAAEGNDLNSLSEERIEEITRQLKGEGEGIGIVCECPICGKVLHSRESDYGVLLHVELCLQQSELGAKQ